MKLFSKEQIYQGDAFTVKAQNITSTELMERVGIQIFNWLHIRMQGAQVPIHIFCGIGNNGGDGLVVARHLVEHGYNIKTYIINYSKTRSKDFLINYEALKNTTKEWPTMLDNSDHLPEIHPNDIIIDAVFGIGLNREVDAWVIDIFNHFRASKAFVLSVDIPSGLDTDKVPENPESVVNAGYTLSFQTPKLVFFLPDTEKYTVQWEAINIGIDEAYIKSTETQVELIGKNEVLPMYQPKGKFSHKGNFGHALILGGSYGKIGAVTLASKAALSAGAGKVSCYVPQCGYIPLQTSFPEAMVVTDHSEIQITDVQLDFTPTVVGLGPGMGTHENTKAALKSFLATNKSPLVVDADALNILAGDDSLLKLLPELSVLTPHPKELERLIGKWTDDFDKLKKAKNFAKLYKVILIIKGAHTITVFNDKLYVNTTGNPGLATAGSGDVLTGVITGLIAQGFDAVQASLFGVYLHGKSADLKVEDTGYQSLIASHVIEGIALAYLDLFKEPERPEIEEVEDKK